MTLAFKNEVQNWDGTVKLLKEKLRLKEKFRLVETFFNENHEKCLALYEKGNAQQFSPIQRIGTRILKKNC